MGLARSMRRKAEREKVKKERPKGNAREWSAQQLSQDTGVKVQTLCEWLEARAGEMQDEMSGNMARLLWEAEDYMATANTVIMLHAVLMTFGSLKTVQKGMGKLVANINKAIEMVDEMGIKEAYEALEEKGAGFEFEDFDINLLTEEPGKAKTVVARMKAKWRERK